MKTSKSSGGHKPADIRNWITNQPSKQRTQLRSALRGLRKAFKEKSSTDLLWWHEVGTYVNEFFPTGKRQYGTNMTELLASELTKDGPKAITRISNDLWQARKIARNLTKQEAKNWTKKQKTKSLSANHFYILVSVEDKDQRNKLHEQCLQDGWSIVRLRAEVQNLFGHKRSRGGRKPQPREIPLPMVALQEIQIQARRWMANHEVWFAGKKASFHDVSQIIQSAEMHQNLRETIGALSKMNRAVGDSLDTLMQIQSHIEGE
ncbi:MAG: hypothetical protein COA78_21565 [Blastopirellula sp.]|nr:MAG: hypothetical protein COA78_21565 [Blastopirellula sp.]